MFCVLCVVVTRRNCMVTRWHYQANQKRHVLFPLHLSFVLIVVVFHLCPHMLCAEAENVRFFFGVYVCMCGVAPQLTQKSPRQESGVPPPAPTSPRKGMSAALQSAIVNHGNLSHSSPLSFTFPASLIYIYIYCDLLTARREREREVMMFVRVCVE
jgi:hypothetical protein